MAQCSCEDEVLPRRCLCARLFTVQCADMSCDSAVSQAAKSRRVPGTPDPCQRTPRRRRRRRRRPQTTTVKAASPSSEGDIRLSPTIIRVKSTFHPSLAFILGGNEDLSDADGDWDEGDCDADLAVDIVLGMFSMVPGTKPTGGGVRSAVLRDANARWSQCYADVEMSQRNSKVHFAAEGRLVETLSADDVDRRGTWEQAASDRMRFRYRISAAEDVISPVLQEGHRQKVLQRMSSHGHL